MNITWVKKGDPLPQRTWEGDKESWSVWVDMVRDTQWAMKSAGCMEALVQTGLGRSAAHGMAQRLYEVFGTDRRVGVHREA